MLGDAELAADIEQLEGRRPERGKAAPGATAVRRGAGDAGRAEDPDHPRLLRIGAAPVSARGQHRRPFRDARPADGGARCSPKRAATMMTGRRSPANPALAEAFAGDPRASAANAGSTRCSARSCASATACALHRPARAAARRFPCPVRGIRLRARRDGGSHRRVRFGRCRAFDRDYLRRLRTVPPKLSDARSVVEQHPARRRLSFAEADPSARLELLAAGFPQGRGRALRPRRPSRRRCRHRCPGSARALWCGHRRDPRRRRPAGAVSHAGGTRRR